jgi:hypothetical protein
MTRSDVGQKIYKSLLDRVMGLVMYQRALFMSRLHCTCPEVLMYVPQHKIRYKSREKKCNNR